MKGLGSWLLGWRAGGGWRRATNGWGTPWPSLAGAKQERGQHLPSLQNQNKPSGREPPPGWREAVQSSQPAQPAAPARPPLPLLIGGFESRRRRSAAAPQLRVCAGLRPRGWRGVEILPDCVPDAGGPGAPGGKPRRPASADCEVCPLRRPLPGPPLGTRLPCAPGGVTSAGPRSCSKVPARILVFCFVFP